MKDEENNNFEEKDNVRDIQRQLEWGMFEIQGSSAFSLDRNRPYDGQLYTDQGERGKTTVDGLTMRDISDCIVRGFLECVHIERKCPIYDDIYMIDLDELDSGAVIKSALCYVEKMMGIYPNVPGLGNVK